MIRIISVIVCAALVITVTVAQETGQKTENRSNAGDISMFSTNRCFSKGGVGIVNKSLYILVRSAANGRNELIVKPTEGTEERWVGRSAAKAEIVFFYGGKVWSAEDLPLGFDLSSGSQ
jgi:hypothetical protein